MDTAAGEIHTLAHLGDVGLELSCELGRQELPLRAVRALKKGDVVVLDKLAGEAMEVRLNGKLFALGETVVVTDLMAVRLTQLIDHTEEVQV